MQRRSVCIFQVALGSNLLNLPPAHRTFGGDVADGLQQVPRLANAANAEEDLRPAGLTRKGWEGHRRWWTNGLRSFSRPLCRNHRSCPDTMRITEAQRGNRVDGCCYRCSTETNCSQLQTPVIIFSPFCFMFSQCWEMLVQETVNGTFFKKRKEGRKEGVTWPNIRWDTGALRTYGWGVRGEDVRCCRRARHTRNGGWAWGTKFHKQWAKGEVKK